LRLGRNGANTTKRQVSNTVIERYGSNTLSQIARYPRWVIPSALRKPDSLLPQTLHVPSLTPYISDILFATNETISFCKLLNRTHCIVGNYCRPPRSYKYLLSPGLPFLFSSPHNTHIQTLWISQHFTSYYQHTPTLQPLELPLRYCSCSHIPSLSLSLSGPHTTKQLLSARFVSSRLSSYH
jgi:hypothetical protein